MIELPELLESRRLFATNGLSATYFDRTEFGGATVSRVDRNANFDFANNRPAPGIHGNTYSVRWTGLVQAPASETFTFRLNHTEGARLWVGGGKLIDDWKVGHSRTNSGTIALRSRHWYDIRIEFFDGTNPGRISLTWSSPTTPESAIPTKRLMAYDQHFAVIGDFGRTTDYARGTANIVNSWAPDFVATVGDNNYTSGGYDENVGLFYHQYVGNYTGTHGAGSRVNRFWPALGNHDWDNEKAYEQFFTLPGNERYYDFVQGKFHFFMLDSDQHEPDGTSSDSVQGKWLENALGSSTSLYNVVIFHHTAYSSGVHGSTKYMRWPFKDWGADVVMSGHDHDYERLMEAGLPYFVDGSGAGPRRPLGSPIPGSQARDDSDSGALLVEANDQFITFQYELRTGKVIDTFTMARA